jgi:rfaE bifunctional protein kinase chain/domain/rfaE bifunctional protein nucleotidyltransferase chain/domain
VLHTNPNDPENPAAPGRTASGQTPTEARAKILTLGELAEACRRARAAGKRVVHCHGCFDLLHIGHIRYFREARSMGDFLVVTISPDRYVDKGPHRPTFTEDLRAEAVASLDSVDHVAVNAWPTAEETLALLKPDIYVKGADFKSVEADRTGKLAREEEVCRGLGTELRFTDDLVFSSTNLINRFFSTFSEEMQNYLELMRRRYSLGEVLGIVDRMATLKVLVVGDVIIDEYCYCHPLGASSKSPVLAVKYDSCDLFAGGVLAVANHIANFAGEVRLLTNIGEKDSHREFIESALHPGVRARFWVQPGAPTLVKKRYVDGYSMTKLLEIYTMDDTGLPPELDAELVQAVRAEAAGCDMAVAADFGHGAVSRDLREALSGLDSFLAVNTQINAGNAHMHTISRYPRAHYISLTERELRLDARDDKSDLRPLVSDMVERFGSEYLAVTRGKKGSVVGTRGGSFVAIPAFASKVVDSVGAGDAFFSISGLAARLGAPRELVGFLGNAAGALAVQMVGNQKAVDRQSLSKFITTILK